MNAKKCTNGTLAPAEGEFERLNDRILRLGLDYDTDLSEFDIDWYEIAIDNEIRRIMEKDD